MGMDVEKLRRRLLARAFLYDDPASYVGGVEQALAAVEESSRNARAGDQPPGRVPLDRRLTTVRQDVS
jgi:hypothetical protein